MKPVEQRKKIASLSSAIFKIYAPCKIPRCAPGNLGLVFGSVLGRRHACTS